ncbi:MAG: hypothetical protein GF346_10500 [Candidatus Eisenbacteria bacterium]|nr:hypothetical protein [Candidatus Latescibacterota bacterium]MBD3302866.1 hypothetical protein [Candidatus Eisenbacteria bacterium]
MLRVESEIGRLRKVLVHAPGPEVDRMVPAMMEDLLFDDILFGEEARQEHRRFRAILETLGVEILEARDLLVETLRLQPARDWLLAALVEDVPRPLRQQILGASAEALAAILIEGIRFDPTVGGIEADDLYEIAPLPNWCFQRDPQVVIRDGVVFSSMATPSRWREALLSGAIFRFHPALTGASVIHDPLQHKEGRPLHLGLARPSFEGGDVMVFSEDLVAIGFSERTNRTGIRHLINSLGARADGPRRVLLVDLPKRRSYMHLDTVVTQIDRSECLAYTPVILPGSSESAVVYEVDLREEDPHPRMRDGGLLDALSAHGIELEPIPCGGDDPVDQQREQWTDGANAFAVAPGIIVLYDRNVATAAALARRGYAIVDSGDLIEGRDPVDPSGPRKVCILIPSHELGRARGGPHCLTQPLVRDPAE